MLAVASGPADTCICHAPEHEGSALAACSARGLDGKYHKVLSIKRHAKVPGNPAGTSRDCRHLQQLLLEAVAIGLVQTSHDIQRLLECTLVFTEEPYTLIHANTMQALFSLSK